MKKTDATKPQKPSAVPGGPTPINISPDEGDKLRECAAKSGLTVADFVQHLIREGIAKLQGTYLTAIPCPFCNRADALEIINWCTERNDLTEYQGKL